MHNFLDSDLDRAASESSGFLEQPPPNSLGHSLRKRSHDTQAHQLINEDVCSGKRSPTSPSSSTQGKSDHTPNGSTNSSLFDLMSSDEDMDTRMDARPTSKKRKVTPVRHGTKQVQGLGRKVNAVSKSHDNRAQDTTSTQSIENISLSSDSERSQAKANALPRLEVTSKPRKRAPAPRRSAAAKIVMDLVESEEDVRVISMASSPTPPHTPVRRSVERQRSNSGSPSAQLIDQLNRSIPSENRLAKQVSRITGLGNNNGGMPSPSQLAMRSLRLTPEEAVRSGTNHGEPRLLTPSRSRRRLIDALDSPRKQSTIQQIHAKSPSSSVESFISGEIKTVEPVSHTVSQTNSNQTDKDDEPLLQPMPALPVVGLKVTYAKQRSHLSDMVLEDLLDFAVPSIAHLVEPVAAPKASTNRSFGSQKSQIALEDPENEEDATTGAIRSIHELRQAGENSRFQGTLDSIFEDLEAAGRTGRSRRLRGLMLLTEKLLEPSFCLRFMEIGMHQRLTIHALKEEDILSSMLASCALSILLSSCKPSLKVLQQVFSAVMHLSVPLLQETREWSRLVKAMAKDRKQNLSGATCKDVIEFQRTVLSSHMWTTPKPTEITPQLVALYSIEIAVRGLRELKDFETLLPLSMFGQLVVILEGIVSDDNNELTAPETVLTLESTISVLEFSVLSHGLLEDGHNEAAERLCILGPLLIKAELLPRERHDKVEQLVLRLIISFTNNNGVLCESLGQTTLIPAISAIVKGNFLELAEYADNGKALDEPKLESVILALAALINFAECSRSSRLSMNERDHVGERFVEWLVTVFNRRAGKASEVWIPLVQMDTKC